MTLRAVRERRRLSQNQLAKLTGISQQFISKLELGLLRDMSLANGIRLSRELHLTPAILNDILAVTRLTHGNALPHEGTACLHRLSSRIGRALARSTAVSDRGLSNEPAEYLNPGSNPLGDDSGPSSDPPSIED